MANFVIQFSFVFDRKKEISLNLKNNLGLIEIRKYLNGSSTYQTTGKRITKDQWDEKKKRPKDKIVCQELNLMVAELQTFQAKYKAIHGTFALSDFKKIGKPIEPPTAKQISFTEFMAKELEAEKVLDQPSLRTRVLSFEYLKRFKANVRFDEINYSLIKSFDLFLHGQKASGRKLNLNTIAKHHKHIRKYIIIAVKNRFLESRDNPYTDFDIPNQPSESNYLTIEELIRFEDLTFSSQETMLERCRDFFLFACYIGLRFNDVYKIKPSDISTTAKGLELSYQANKTKKFGIKALYALFDARPQTIALKYMSQDQERPLFKGLTNPKVNLNLKILATRAKVNKKTKFKDSRNTFANCLLDAGLPINYVQDEMQHAMLSTTQIYLKQNTEAKFKALSKIDWNNGRTP